MYYWLKTIFWKVARRLNMTEFTHVKRFHQKFGLITNGVPVHLTRRKLNERIEFLQEELDEFQAACVLQDLDGQADALIDLVYVAKGTAVMLGLPWEALWDDVHRANMEKVRGVSHRGHAVDCVKPPYWTPPMTTAILYDHGYRKWNYRDDEGEFREELCYDDH